MLIKVGYTVWTAYCTGEVLEVINNHPHSDSDIPHLKIKVTDPKIHWRRRTQIVRLDECKGFKKNDKD